MGVASVVMKDVASGVLRDEAAAALEAAGDVGPIEKLQALLTRVRPPDRVDAGLERGCGCRRRCQARAPMYGSAGNPV